MVSRSASAFLLVIAAVLSSSSPSIVVDALELTAATFDEMTAGKTVFLKMYAPWCGHCKAMAEDWSKLEGDFDGHDVAFVASVDCTNEDNIMICVEAGVQGYPTLVWGGSADLQQYQGGRDYESLKAFADRYVTKPVCGLSTRDACTDEEKAAIDAVASKSDDELTKTAETVRDLLRSAENDFEEYVERLQVEFEKKQDEHDDRIRSIRAEHDFNVVSTVLKSRGLENPVTSMDFDLLDDDDDIIEDDPRDEL
eukprot:CAMPEP_0197196012 /NCGR_PEP_ID=MMETSP1423-20130617/32126_1 /TAXON_ID=476441 /ORGANISM="Pseudo-nitzschia heimii, Strain UNC1101" /LENGTH=252 /DNA_ID=CAMNT_0042649775 /DNA_START=483 /DNA_END=1241 /DNA_ORIENTATION=-